MGTHTVIILVFIAVDEIKLLYRIWIVDVK